MPEDGPDRHRLARDGAPQIEIRDTDYGFVYGARRRFDDRYYQEMALAKGKQTWDKRETERRKTADKEAREAIVRSRKV